MGVGLLYTYALARIFSKHKGDTPDDFSRRDVDFF